jgi:molybdopterin adenylyltransferase
VVLSSPTDPTQPEDRAFLVVEEWFERVVANPKDYLEQSVQSEQTQIESALVRLVDQEQCCLVLTVGGVGPGVGDLVPEATLAVADKDIPGMGERMRSIGRGFVPTVILSRALAALRGQSLILNLPSEPSAIVDILDALFPVVPYCIDLAGGPYIETNPGRVEAYRPTAVRLQRKDEDPPSGRAVKPDSVSQSGT